MLYSITAMRTLPAALLQTQKDAPFVFPAVRVRIRNRRGSAILADWTRPYTGPEPDGPHAATAPGDGSLCRARIDPAVDKLYYQRLADPGTDADNTVFGKNIIGTNTPGTISNHKLVCRYTTPAAATITRVYCYCRALLGTINAKAVIYSDNAGAPDALLAVSDELPGIDTTATWREFTLSTPLAVTAGTVYHIGLIVDGSVIIYADAGTTDQCSDNADTYADGPTDPFGAPATTPDNALSIYAASDGPSPWTYLAAVGAGSGVALASTGATVLLFYVAPDTITMLCRESTDYGVTFGAPDVLDITAGAVGPIAGAIKSDGTALCVYYKGTTVYTVKRVTGVWQAAQAWPNSANAITGIACQYNYDWEILVAGVATDGSPVLWASQFSDELISPPDEWQALRTVMTRPSTEPFTYAFPFSVPADVNRAFFVESHTDPVTQDRIYWTHQPTDTHYGYDTWLEPVPFNLETPYGAALAYSAPDLWLTTPYGIWHADLTPTTWDITGYILEIRQQLLPGSYRSRLDVVLDNTAGIFNSFSQLGREITLELGYVTLGGPLYSETPPFYITGWRHVSPPWFPLRAIFPQGVIGTLHIVAEDIWTMLQRWRPRRTIEWLAGQKSVFLMLQYLFARIGFLLLDSGSPSMAIINFEPEFSVTLGRTGRWAVQKLLSYVEDVPFQQGNAIYVKCPEADDASDYTYHHTFGTAHLCYRGRYDTGAWDPNRAQVWGTTLMLEDYEFDQIDRMGDRLSRVTDPDYPDTTRAAERATAELRKGEMFHKHSGWVQVPTNCGQEPWDVITITDVPAGVTAIKRRVAGIETRYKKLAWLYWQVLTLAAV